MSQEETGDWSESLHRAVPVGSATGDFHCPVILLNGVIRGGNRTPFLGHPG